MTPMTTLEKNQKDVLNKTYFNTELYKTLDKISLI